MISVVIPVYNVEKYIGYCLASLENQVYKDFEVIIVNDGSQDNSLKEIERYVASSSMNIKVITQANAGVSVARNTGIEASTGEYIAFIDSDDVLHPEYLSKHLSNIKDAGADVSVCRRMELDESVSEYCGEIQKFEINICTQEETLKDMLFGKIKAGIWSLLCKREILGDLRFAVNVAYGEDLEMVWKLVARAKKIAIDNTQLYGYRIRESSAMGKMSPKRVAGMRLFEQLEGYFMNENPEFAPLFCKYGVARWVWATMWQAAVAATSYRNFKESMSAYSPKERMLKLLKYPDFKVRCSSLLYVISPFLYYCFVKAIRKKLRNVS